MRRRGPRPLALHLSGMLNWTSFAPGWPSASGSWPSSAPGWPPPLPAADPELVRAIAAYRRHGWERTLPDPPALWSEGDSRLLDYGPEEGRPVLFVPSLVNRAYVLDLMEGQSMLRWLAARGVRPLLLDWGWPGAAERRFTLSDLIGGRLERALLAMRPRLGRAPLLAGYCMGGLLALAAALRRPDLVGGLILLATPWDFHADPSGPRVAAILPLLEPALQATGTLPVDALQALFAAVEPQAIAHKYRAFARLDPASEAAIRFVALEDWVNDGVPLAAPVAREALAGWYGANAPCHGAWRVGGRAIRPESLSMPAFVAIPGHDRIVPPLSAQPLADMITGAVVHRPAAGHIGMVAGPRAETSLWRPLLDWIAAG